MHHPYWWNDLFVYKYKRNTPKDKTAYITHSTILEFLWSFIPLVIFLFVFAWGWHIYHEMRKMPTNAIEVHVVGKQWAWNFKYKSGKETANEFVVPVGQDVKLIMSSLDVLHSFYIPSMRIKQDVVPGRYTALTFKANKTGNYHVFCTEYCVASHAKMLSTMKVVSMAEYEEFLRAKDEMEGLSLPERGAKLYNLKACVGCHSVTPETQGKSGPSWHGLFGKNIPLEDGSSVLGDENYIRESILNPQAKIHKGYAGVLMPSYQGQLNEDEVSALIEYIKTLK